MLQVCRETEALTSTSDDYASVEVGQDCVFALDINAAESTPICDDG